MLSLGSMVSLSSLSTSHCMISLKFLVVCLACFLIDVKAYEYPKTHLCWSNRSVTDRFSSVNSFFYSRGHKGQLYLSMFAGNQIYQFATSSSEDESFPIPRRSVFWKNFTKMNTVKLPERAVLRSIYFFSRNSNTDNSAARGVSRVADQILLNTDNIEQMWSSRRRRMLRVSRPRRHPLYTLALSPQNRGYIIHRDVYESTENDLVIYPFEYQPVPKAASFGSGQALIHQFEAKKAKQKASPGWYFMELTDSENEVVFVNHRQRNPVAFNRVKAFLHTRPRGWISGPYLYLVDRHNRCLHRLHIHDPESGHGYLLHNSKSKSNTASITVRRDNYNLADFFPCQGEEANKATEVSPYCRRSYQLDNDDGDGRMYIPSAENPVTKNK